MVFFGKVLERQVEEEFELTGGVAKSRFEDFWEVYPRKEAKKPARDKWVSKRLDKYADLIIEDVRKRQRFHFQWRDGFVPLPATYLNQERWEDEISEDKPGSGKKKKTRPLEPWMEKHQAYVRSTYKAPPKIDKWTRRCNLVLLRYIVKRGGLPEDELQERVILKNRVAEDFRMLEAEGEEVSHFEKAATKVICRKLRKRRAA